jgi:DNA-binding LytR/AlgR family response regulator
MRWKEYLDAPFPFYLNNDRKNVLLILVMALFVFVFLIFFKTSHPNHLELNTVHKIIFAGITFSSLYFTIIILPRIFRALFDADQWTIKKYIAHTLLNIGIIGVFSTAVDEFIICPERSLFDNFIHASQQVIIIGSIPVALVTLFVRNNMLKENLRHALHANTELTNIQQIKDEWLAGSSHDVRTVTLRSETSETLHLLLRELLFVEANDNYSTVYWSVNGSIQKKLLRINLKNVETQVNNQYALRCHRSFLVNVAAIERVSGNASGYKLHIRNTAFSIPVSRNKGKDIIEKIGQLSNGFTLA